MYKKVVIQVKRKKYFYFYLYVFGREHFPVHIIITTEKLEGQNLNKPAIKVDLLTLGIMREYNGGLKSEERTAILNFLSKNPNFVEELIKIFFELNPHLRWNETR